jgi:hypothetical protein
LLETIATSISATGFGLFAAGFAVFGARCTAGSPSRSFRSAGQSQGVGPHRWIMAATAAFPAVR